MDGTEYGSGHIPTRGIPSPNSAMLAQGVVPQMLAYGTTGSGHAGNDTSRERQEREDATGLTGRRQRAVLKALEEAKFFGVTSAEMEALLGVGHGQASSALSHLHRAGHIRRLKERRNAQEIYVMRDCVGDRKESPYNPRPGRKHPKFHSDRTVMEAMAIVGMDTGTESYTLIRKFLEALP